jgi:hypothetical protein
MLNVALSYNSEHKIKYIPDYETYTSRKIKNTLL